jgi:hypothetical protein
MSRSGLKFTAVLLSLLIVTVLFAGLDNLPRGLRKQIDSERATLASAQSQLQAARAEVGRDLQSEAALFAGIPASRQWPARFDKAGALFQSAARDMETLSRLQRDNRRQDRPRVESLLSEERGHRASAAAEASSVQKEAAHWIDLKQHLPQALQQMDKDYRAIHEFDLASGAAAAEKAGRDWPEKKADLDARLAAGRALAAESDRAWEASAAARRQAASGNYANLDFGALLGTADLLRNAAADLPRKAGELKSLSAQLYDSWDKVLVDLETRGIGNSKEYDQKIRTVKVHVADSSSQTGNTTSEERWVTVPRSTFQAMQNNLGMAIEHKPAGKYDSEVERTPQPAGFAYMAPPSQGSNQYGRWEHRDGRDFWVFYGQYALMRDLLFNSDYRPLDRGEWDQYRTSRSRGETYYGRESGSGQKYGTQGATTQQRYSGSSYAERGGFKDSKYASKSGSYRDSQYATPAQRNPDIDRSPRSFGRNSEPRYSPPPSRTYRPSPAPRQPFRVPSGPGRRFGRR